MTEAGAVAINTSQSGGSATMGRPYGAAIQDKYRHNGRGSDPASSKGPLGAVSVVAMLVREAGRGNQDVWNGLVDRFSSTVWAIARGHRINSADAADVFQTTWLRLLENLDRIQQPERVGAWLATTARRECLRFLRMSGRQIPNGDDFDVFPGPGTMSRSHDSDLVATERKDIVNPSGRPVAATVPASTAGCSAPTRR